jgi:plasmid stabilization system protein ParE
VSYRIVFTAEAEEDLLRLFEFLLQRELAREGGDATLPQRAIEAIHDALTLLEKFPFTCKKAGSSALLRELVIPFGHTGYVALFEILDQRTVAIAAVRHQREEDYH